MSSNPATGFAPVLPPALEVPLDAGEAVSEINSSARIPALDGLRGIAILLVLIVHTISDFSFVHHPALNWLVRLTRLSWSGVDLFFVLSGFLIGGILLDERSSPTYFKTFYLRRACRILPLHFLVLTLAWLIFEAGQLGWLRGAAATLFNGKIPWWSFFTFTQNISMAVAGRYAGSRLGLAPTWSLAVEEQFYLTLPLVVRYAPKRRLVQIVVASIAVAALLRFLVALYFPNQMFATYLLTPCRADALGFGVLAAVLVREPKAWSYLREHRAWLYGAAGILFTVFLLIDLSSFESFSTTLYGVEYSIFAAFYASLLLIAITGTDWFVRGIFCNQALMKLGVIAYGTYLLHRFTIRASQMWMGSVWTSQSFAFFAGATFLGVAAAILLAQISWTWFEKPMVRRGHHYRY